MESVFPENESGPETVAAVSEPVPLPVSRPPRVVEPVPPFPTPRVPVRRLVPMEVVATMAPEELVERRELGRPESVTVPVAVMFAAERLPEKSPLPCTESAWDGEVVPTPKKPEEFQIPFGKLTVPTKVEDAVARSPLVNPTVVEVDTP